MDSTLSVQAGFLAILRKSKRDFLSLPMIVLNILPVLFGVALWGGILYVFCDVLIAYATGLLPESLQAYINDNGILGRVITISLYALLGFCVILLALVGNVFVSIFYAPLVVGYIRKYHYPYIPKPASVPILVALKQFLKAFVLLCALCVVCMPLVFIPVIGGVIMLVPFFVFFYQTMLFDVGQEVLGRDDYPKLHKAKRKYTIALLTYLLGLIPILNFFTPLLQVIILSHYCFHTLLGSQAEQSDHSPRS